MPDISPQDVANKLLSDGFTRDGPVASGLTIDLAPTSTTSLSAPARTTLELSELHGAARAHG